MKRIILIINILLICAVCAGNYLYMTVGGIEIKSLTSAGFALIGIVNFAYIISAKKHSLKFPAAMATGLVLAMLGDIIIGENFILGAALFAAGHICYLIAFCLLMKITKRDLIFSAAFFLFGGSFVLFCPLLTFEEPIMKWVCFVYALIISMMTGKAVSNFTRHRNTLTAIIAVGSILFYFSDFMLVLDWFMNAGPISGILCMATYYPAECLLAHSSFLTSSVRIAK